MKDFVSKYSWFCVEVIFAIYSIIMILSIYNNTDLLNTSVAKDLQQTIISENVLVNFEVPLVDETNFKVYGDILERNCIFDWKKYVTVNDSKGNNLVNYVVVDGNVDTTVPGKYNMNFILNWNGITIVKSAEFFVNE